MLAQTLNGPTRGALSTLRAGGNRSGADAVLTWQTGYPIAILNGELEKQLGVPGYPWSGILDPDGNLIYAGSAGAYDAPLKKGMKVAKPGSIWPKHCTAATRGCPTRSCTGGSSC